MVPAICGQDSAVGRHPLNFQICFARFFFASRSDRQRKEEVQKTEAIDQQPDRVNMSGGGCRARGRIAVGW